MFMKKATTILIYLFFSVGLQAAGQFNIIADSIVNYGKKFLSVPYQYGANGVDYFDCSGFTAYIFRNFGYELPRASWHQAKQFTPVQQSQLKKADLVFFDGVKRNGVVGHVGIVVSAKKDGSFKFIHASYSQGVTISDSNEPYFKKRYLKASRVIKPGDPFISKIYHMVRSGESLSLISSLYNIPIAELRRNNNLPDNRIKAGQELFIRVRPGNSPSYVSPGSSQIHRVRSGESLSLLAVKYGVSVSELKEMNNLSSDRIRIGQKLSVGKGMNTSVETSPSSQTHRVRSGESLSLLAVKYGVSVSELKEMNNLSSDRIRVGQMLVIGKEISASIEIPSSSQTHQVQAGESISVLALKYNISVSELKKMNDLRNDRIHVGQTLVVKKSQGLVFSDQHEVKNGDTLFSIAQAYGISVNELKKMNNKKTNRLTLGETLIIKKNIFQS